jgi:hypothetical protein
MKSILFMILTSVATASAFASTFACAPGKSLNGLGIKSIVLDISDEDPEARMTLKYSRSTQAILSNMSYEGDNQSGYQLTPNSNKDGDISVGLSKKGNKWEAHVNSGTIDTFSILDCEEK